MNPADLSPEMRSTQNEHLRALLRALDLHGPGEADHAERVAVFSVATGEFLGMSDEELLVLRRAAILHDVGKIAIDQNLIRKLGQLSDEEFTTLKLHSALSESVLEGFPWLLPSLPLIKHHHERFDGGGYPDGLTGEAIPLGARIIGVAETFDHLAHGAFWKPPLGRARALQILDSERGKQLDPRVVDAFISVEPLILPLEL